MSPAEFAAQAKDLKQVAHPSLMHLAEVRGEPVGFIVALPDANRAIAACNGRLLPFGWWRFLRALRQVDSARVITLGVLPIHRKLGIETLMMHAVLQHGMKAGYIRGEASWILEDNADMLGPLQALGFRPYRRYRIYEKALV
jgi:GNAT superfamily N-acetyltransferase